MYFLMLLTLFSFALSLIIYKKPKFFNKKNILIYFIVCILISFSSYFFNKGLWWQFSSGFFGNLSYTILPIAVFVSYLGRIGIYLLFSFYGIFLFYDHVWLKEQKFEQIFLIISYISLFLLLPVAQYLNFIILTYSSLFGAYAIYFILDNLTFNKQIKKIILIIIILIIISISLFMLNYWRIKYDNRGDGLSLNEQSFLLTNYMKENLNGSIIFNDRFMSVRTFAFTEIPSTPVTDQLYISSGLVNISSIPKINYSLNSIIKYRQLSNSYLYFPYLKMYNYPFYDKTERELLQKNNFRYFVINKNCQVYAGYCIMGNGLLQQSIIKNKNKIYDDGGQEIWSLK